MSFDDFILKMYIASSNTEKLKKIVFRLIIFGFSIAIASIIGLRLYYA